MDLFHNGLPFHSCRVVFLTAFYTADCPFDQWVDLEKNKLGLAQKHHPIVWHDPLMSQEACFSKGNDLEPSQSRRKTTGLANTECCHGSRKLCDILRVCMIAKARGILKYWKVDSIWTTVTFPYNYITIFDIHLIWVQDIILQEENIYDSYERAYWVITVVAVTLIIPWKLGFLHMQTWKNENMDKCACGCMDKWVQGCTDT